MKFFSNWSKLTSLSLAISLSLSGQIVLANTESTASTTSKQQGLAPLQNTQPATSNSSQTNQPKATTTPKNAVTEAVSSVYRIWLTIPLDSTFVYMLEQNYKLPIGSQEKLDKQGYIREISNSGKEVVLFKYQGKIHLVAGHGSGYAVTNDGILVTNNHVVNPTIEELYGLKQELGEVMKGDPEVFIVTSISPNFKIHKADIIDAKKEKDLAILKVQNLPTKALKLASIEHIQQADNVTAIGFPYTSDEFSGGLDDTKSYVNPVTDNGSLKRQITQNNISLWEHGVNITSGNSGGPLINQCGEVVATNVNVYSGNGITLTAGAISLTELLPLLQSNNITFNQVNVACNPNAITTATVATGTKPTPTDKSSNVSATKALDNKSKILGLDSTIFWIVLGGIGFAVLAIIIFLVTRKKEQPITSSSGSYNPPPPASQLPRTEFQQNPAPKTQPNYTGGKNTEIAQGKSIHLNGDYPITLHENVPFTIGRDPNSSLVISNGKVSSRHIQLVYRNNQIFVTDLQSTNGTYINGHRVSGEMSLKHGDTLSLTQENIANWQYGQGSSHVQRAIGELVPEGLSMSPITLYAGKHLTLGRNSNNDIVINNSTVSGSHCTIVVDNNGNIEITDNNSTNGTFIEQMNNRITRASLKPQQVLYIGSSNTRFKFKKF